MISKLALLENHQTLIHAEDRKTGSVVVRVELIAQGLGVITATASFDDQGNRTSQISYSATCAGVPTSPPTATADFPQKLILECPDGNFDIAGE